jgi:hypothetical protein
VQRASVLASADLAVRAARLEKSKVGGHGDERFELTVEGMYAV